MRRQATFWGDTGARACFFWSSQRLFLRFGGPKKIHPRSSPLFSVLLKPAQKKTTGAYVSSAYEKASGANCGTAKSRGLHAPRKKIPHDENVVNAEQLWPWTTTGCFCLWSDKLNNFKHASEINSGENSESAQKSILKTSLCMCQKTPDSSSKKKYECWHKMVPRPRGEGPGGPSKMVCKFVKQKKINFLWVTHKVWQRGGSGFSRKI